MSMKTFRPFGRSLRAVPCMRCHFLSLSKCILLHQSTSMHLAICCLGVHSTGHILALLSPWHGPMYTTRIWHLGEWVDISGFYRSIDMVPQSELRCVFELWVACQNKNVKLEALKVLNTLKVGCILPLEVACLLGMLSFSLWTAFFVATVLHTCYEMTLGGDTFGASRTRLSWIPVSWWCSECSILS